VLKFASVGVQVSVLVVDDNAENRALAKATLEDEGYAVTLATTGEEALAAFARATFDCVLLDIRMPGMDGIATCTRLRELPGGVDVPILFVTAQRDVDTFDRARDAGGDDFITKPFRPTELVARVGTASRLRRMAAERSGLYEQIRRQRDDLLRLQLVKEQLTAFLVHDLKNPVNAIELHAQRIQRERCCG
jgi:two-component system, sensor histidine kinase and response regulator